MRRNENDALSVWNNFFGARGRSIFNIAQRNVQKLKTIRGVRNIIMCEINKRKDNNACVMSLIKFEERGTNMNGHSAAKNVGDYIKFGSLPENIYNS